MIPLFMGLLTSFSAFLRSRYSLGLEIVALRQQLGVRKRKHLRPQLRIRDYVSYYHADRIHDSSEKDTPAKRSASSRPDQSAQLISFTRIGGLHRQYDWRQAA
jgi:hypothetical protein